MKKHKIIFYKKTGKELNNALLTGMCGHPIDPPLSRAAKRLYKFWLKHGNKAEYVIR